MATVAKAMKRKSGKQNAAAVKRTSGMKRKPVAKMEKAKPAAKKKAATLSESVRATEGKVLVSFDDLETSWGFGDRCRSQSLTESASGNYNLVVEPWDNGTGDPDEEARYIAERQKTNPNWDPGYKGDEERDEDGNYIIEEDLGIEEVEEIAHSRNILKPYELLVGKFEDQKFVEEWEKTVARFEAEARKRGILKPHQALFVYWEFDSE